MIPHRVPRSRALLRSPPRLGASMPLDGASALPAEAVRTLRLVAAEMRDMPRDCATDRRELVHWLGRLARRLDAVMASKARAPAPAVPATPAMVEAPIAVPETDRPQSAPATRKRVAAAARRRAEAAGQFDLFR